MKIAGTICRILLGLLVVGAGWSGVYLLFQTVPSGQAGLLSMFQDVYYSSHWVLFVDAVELIAGALLLANRFVPLSLAMLAGVTYSIVVYHLTLEPFGLPFALVMLACWIVVATRYQSSFKSPLRPVPLER